MENEEFIKGDLRVVHIAQFPGPEFKVHVETVEDGQRIMGLLADYDLWQFTNNIKPDYANVNWLEIFDGQDWEEVELDDEI